METLHPLKAYRLAQNPPLKLEVLAERLRSKGLKTSKGTLSRWERGRRGIDVDQLKVVSEVTGIPAAKLRPDLAALFVGGPRRRATRTRRAA